MSSPNEHHIAVLAYEYWVERGRPLGSPEVDWYRAVETLSAGYVPLSAFHAGPDTTAIGPMHHHRRA